MSPFIQARLRPFQNPNFRRFFAAQTLSLVGTWAHDLARSWLVIQLMGNATALGSLLLAIALPGLVLTLQGGVLADRADVKKIMFITKSILAIASLVLAGVVEFSHIQMWHLLLFGVIEGCVVAFDSPTFQALTVRMVPRKDFQQAIALNSTNFHAGRMLGPVVAGVLMLIHGPSLVFFFDFLSYLGVIYVLRNMRLKHLQKPVVQAPGASLLWDGIHYAFGEPSLRYILAQLLLTICLVNPLMVVIFRTYLAAKFHLSGEQFGTLFMFPAMGSMLGALSFTVFQPKRPLLALKLGVPVAVVSLILLPLCRTELLAAICMSVVGFSTYLSLASLTVSVHLSVKEEYRGRVSSIIGMGFGSIGPLMSLPVGLYGDTIGYEPAIYSLALIFGAASAVLAYLNRSHLKNIVGIVNENEAALESPFIKEN